MTLRRLRIQDFAVGWVCALPIEIAAATAMLDEKHQSLPHDDNDPYLYTLGCIGEHNVVLACLPAGQMGTNWDAETGAARRTLQGHSGSVSGVAFSPDGHWSRRPRTTRQSLVREDRSGAAYA
jgi:hypothetical protein